MKQSSVSPTEPDFADNLKKLVGDKTFLVPQISVVSFAKLMNSTTANEHRRWLLQILLNTKHNGILVQFAESKGLFVLDQWMRENADDQSPILIPILQLLKLLPITLQILTKPGLKLGKLVRNLCKTQAPSGSDEARKLANYLKAAWTKLTLIPAANAPSTVADAETLKRPHTAIDRPASKKPESIKTIPRKMAKTDSQPSAEIFDIFKTVESFKPDVVAKPLPKIQRNNSLPIALPIAKRKAEETPAAAEEKHVKISEQDEIKGPSYSRAISPPIEETVKPVEEAAVIPTAVSSITGKPKKRVQWKTNLTQIRFFESVETITVILL